MFLRQTAAPLYLGSCLPCLMLVTPLIAIACDRSNLDPFERHTDQDLWKALEKFCLKSTVSV